jgi:hypothetical protein
MRPPRLAAASLVVLVVGTLSACSPPAVDQVALGRWQADRAARGADDGSTTTLTSTAPAGASQGSVSADLAEPLAPSSLTFECFGDGRISLQVTGSISSARGTTTTVTTVGDLDCADGPHELEPSAVGGDGLVRLEAETWGADRDTAWALTLRGDPATA